MLGEAVVPVWPVAVPVAAPVCAPMSPVELDGVCGVVDVWSVPVVLVAVDPVVPVVVPAALPDVCAYATLMARNKIGVITIPFFM